MSLPTLKRPRSTSNPPSPSSTSSPKRAASEDPFPSSSDSGLLSPGMQGVGAPGSSPLRLDVDGEDEEGEGGEWVKRTGEVHLSSDRGYEEEEEQEEGDIWQRRYGELLGCVPPPFTPWDTFYILPASLMNDIKALAHATPTKSSPSTHALTLDLSPLLKRPEPDVVWTPVLERAADGRSAVLKGKEQAKVWSVKDGLVENEDFMFVSAEGWEKVKEWCGTYAGPELARTCLPSERIQMVPPTFTLYQVQSSPTSEPPSALFPPASAPAESPIRLAFPSEASLSTLSTFLTSLLPSPPPSTTPLRTWTLDVASLPSSDTSSLPALSSLSLPPTLLPSLSGRLLSPSTSTQNLTLAEAGLESGDALAIEIPKMSPLDQPVWAVDVNEQGKAVEKAASTIPVPTAPAPLFSRPAFYAGSGEASGSGSVSSLAVKDGGVQTRSQSRKGARRGKGLVGLVNLGNTCFMNSATQCLSNTPELSEYFLSGVYKNELNPDNPLGMGGAIAEAFGTTVEALWSPSSSSHASFSPRNLKWTTSRFAPQFAGYGQHDTQEFIAFLLDGLHEDLNRIKKKPYVEKPDWKPGGGDRELADLGKECWQGYKRRNDSVIVDLFQGQLRSTLVCPECHKESITLDPFMYLTVPLPIAQHRTFKLHYVPRDTDKPPIKVELLIPQNASFMQIKEKLAGLVKANPANIVGFDLWKGSIYSWFMDNDHNGEAKDSDVPVFYELGAPSTSSRRVVGTMPTDGSVTVPVYTFKSVEPSRHSYARDATASECALQPFFITLSKAQASDPVAVRDAITKGYGRFVRADMRDKLWVPKGSAKAASAITVDAMEEAVTEIHVEQGGETKVVEVPGSSSDGGKMELDVPSPVISQGASSVNGLHAGTSGSTASLGSASNASIKSTTQLAPRGDLFKVHVADASSGEAASSSFNPFKGPAGKEPVMPLYKGTPSSASAHWSTLENRRKAKKSMMGRFKSIVGGAGAGGTDDEASPPSTPVSAPLVVRPGEGIFCEWSPTKFADYFDADHVHHALWEDPETSQSTKLVDPAIAKEIAKKKEGRSITLDDCLDEFSREETLGQDDLWYCPQCKKHQAATKKMEIYQAPDILVICIKRFGSSRRLSDKLDNFVGFPIEGLDLSERIGGRGVVKRLGLDEDEAEGLGIEGTGEEAIYDLYAVDNHFGGMGGGHYTAFCKNKDDGDWYNYDDSRVSKASPNAVQSKAAYLLFYRRRTSRPIGGISRIKAEEASRAASPMPPDSPPLSEATPTQDDDDAESSDASDKLPSYSAASASVSANPSPSPTLSLASGGEVDLTAVGARLGYGNVAWGSGAAGAGQSSVQHGFASGSGVDTDEAGDLGNAALGHGSGGGGGGGEDEGFEKVEKTEGESGSEEGGFVKVP